MLFEFFAPEGLERMAASVHCFEFGGIGTFAAQIAPLYPFPFHPGVLTHGIKSFYLSRLTQKMPKVGSA